MKVRALTSFSGRITMRQGEVRNIKDIEFAKELIDAGFAKAVRKRVKNDEDK